MKNCSEFKYLPWTDPNDYHYRPYLDNTFFRAWHSPWNPLGNYHEPTAFPEHMRVKAASSKLNHHLYWALRNPVHNAKHFGMRNPLNWIIVLLGATGFIPLWFLLTWLIVLAPFGIVPIGDRYEWVAPECDGWTRHRKGEYLSYWKKKYFGGLLPVVLPYFKITRKWQFYIGWSSRGSFGMALRRR